MKQVFIIGNPRSGTSFLRSLLTNHPDIVIPPESHFFLWLEEKYSDWSAKEEIKPFLDDLYASTKFETWHLNRNDLQSWILSRHSNSFQELIESIYLFYGVSNGKHGISIWGDKNKLWKDKLGSIKKYFPNAIYIHLVRDGRDVACSFKELASKKFESKYAPKLPSDIKSIANRWAENVDFIEEFKRTISEDNFIEVKYENLIQETEDELKLICRALNISFDQDMLYFNSDVKNFMFEPSEFMEWKSKLSDIPDFQNIGKYRNQLTDSEIVEFQKLAKTQLNRYKYHIDG